MTIAKGMTVGPYEILAHIGEGGMGEVWRARDRRIGRDVAVKVLPESFAEGDERLWRFEQEARAAGALNHPGLVTIFDVGRANSSPYIVMELLEGETLRDAIGDGAPVALPLRKAIDYAMQVATALSVAHEKGIIHRDLKPENIFITSDGRVKILDFGLAKLAEGTGEADSGPRKTTRHKTSAGIAVGTPGYMSPEQVRAQPVDHRTDLFSLGGVMYEMISGRPAFDCFSAVETMHAVLNIDPPTLSSIDPKIPPSLDAIVMHCLEKNPRDRFQSARDLAFQLRMLQNVQSSIIDARLLPPAPKRFPIRTILGAVAVLAAAAVGLTLYRARGGGELRAPSRTIKQLTFSDGLEMFPTLAPDGKLFAYVSSQSGNRDIYVQRVDGRTPINITKDSLDDDSEPVFSPDGSQIAFRSERDGGGIFVMGVTGESVVRLTTFGHNPSWSPDATRIVVSTVAVGLQPNVRGNGGELWIIDTRTQATRPLVRPRKGGPDFGRESDAAQPAWSPHGKRIAFWGLSASYGRDIWTIDPNAPEPKRTVLPVTSDAALDWNPVWSPDGKHIYFGSDRDGTLNLWRIAIDEASGKTTGTPEQVALPAPVSGNFAFSQKGDLAYAAVSRAYRLLAFPFDPASGVTGAPQPLYGGSLEILSFELSPDGQSIAFTTAGAQEDLFVVNADGTRLRQLTNDVAKDRCPTWTPDSKTLYLYSNREGAFHIWTIRADGSGLARITDAADFKRIGARNVYVPRVSPDGRTLVAETDDLTALVHLDRPFKQRIEAVRDHLEKAQWSPAGNALVGAIIKENVRSIGVYSLATRQSEQVLDHGLSPQWLPDGKRIAFFEAGRIGILDLESRQVSMLPFAPLPGVNLDNLNIWPRLSANGSTLYVPQTLEQGDIWLLRLDKSDASNQR